MRSVFTSSCFIHFEGKVLLIHHSLLNFWLPVGGEIEGDESPMACAYREALEETGIEVEFRHDDPGAVSGTPAGFIGYEEHLAGPKGEHKNFCFLGHAVRMKYGSELEPIRPGGYPNPRSDGSWNGFSWVAPGNIEEYSNLPMPQNVRDLLLLIRMLVGTKPESSRRFLSG